MRYSLKIHAFGQVMVTYIAMMQIKRLVWIERHKMLVEYMTIKRANFIKTILSEKVKGILEGKEERTVQISKK